MPAAWKIFLKKYWRQMLLAAAAGALVAAGELVLSEKVMLHGPGRAEAAVRVGGDTVEVLLADTNEERVRGLSGRERDSAPQGMLFVFPEAGRHIFVMRAMRFPLDIIWLDDGMVVDIQANLPPDPARREEDLIRYTPRFTADMVWELPAGEAARRGIGVGTRVSVWLP